MHALIALGLSLVALPALAEPKVGTYVAYEVDRVFQGEPARYVQRRELVAYDPVKKVFRETLTVFKPGEPPVVNESQVPLSYLLDKEKQVEKMLSECTGAHRRIVDVEVPAGKFRSCELTSKSNRMESVMWFAALPLDGLAMETVDTEFLRHKRTLLEYRD